MCWQAAVMLDCIEKRMYHGLANRCLCMHAVVYEVAWAALKGFAERECQGATDSLRALSQRAFAYNKVQTRVVNDIW